MSLLPDLPDLRVLLTDSLQPHEHTDDQRAIPLAGALKKQGILKDPPIVMPLDEGESRFVVLDGANRTTAFKMLEIPFIVAQVVRPNEDSIQVSTWNHIVLETAPERLLEAMRTGEAFDLVSAEREGASRRLERIESHAFLILPDESVFEVPASDGFLHDRIAILNRLVGTYIHRYRLERTTASKVDGMAKVYGEFACLVVFPRFRVEDVLDVTSAGLLFPGGVTRFMISPRALRVNYPLALLVEGNSQEEKAQALESFVQQRVKERRVRFYAESTILFDE